MGDYISDTESESYRFDNSNNSSEESVTDLDIPEFNDKKAIEIAEYLDSKYYKPSKNSLSSPSSSSSPSTNLENKTFRSPSTDKIWTPLSQSTPAEIPTNRVQPKDILKAKSKLSRLSANANDYESTKLDEDIDTGNDADTDDDDDHHTQESSRDTNYHEDTPSKTNKKKSIIRSAEKKKLEADLKELEELRQLKKYITNLPYGSIIFDGLKNPNNTQPKILPATELEKTDKQNQSLKELVTNVTNQNSELKGEISILKNTNADLKEEISVHKDTNASLKESNELKTGNLNDLKDKFKDMEDKLKELQKSKEESELRFKDLEINLKELTGDSQAALTPHKYPSLNSKAPNGKSIYDQLELQMVDSLNLTQAHNIIKNILINLLIPFTETKQTIPKIGKLLKNEDVLCEFTNRLHLLLYQQEFNISKYQTREDGSESLKQCTSQILKNVKVLYQAYVSNE